MLLRRLIAPASVLILCAGIGTNASALMIDSFDAASHHADAPVGPIPSFGQVGGPGLLGGYRDVEVDSQTASPSFFETSAEANGSGTIQFENGVGVNGKVTFTWDGNDNPLSVDTNGLGGVDLTEAGTSNAFGLDVVNIDQAGLEIMFTVWSGSGSSTFTSVTGPAGTTTMLFGFASFSGNADFTDVGAIQMMLTSSLSDGIDAELDLLEATFDASSPPAPEPSAVPVPAALPMIAGAFGGLFGLKYIRRRNAAS